MRILIIGAGGGDRTEASLARAAEILGHTALVLDALGWRRTLGPLTPRFLAYRAKGFAPDFVVCTRHALAAGAPMLQALLARVESAFWYVDAVHPLPDRVLALARLTSRVHAASGRAVDDFRAAGLSALVLPQGMDPLLDRPADTPLRDSVCEVSFVGSGQFPRRTEMLRSIAARFQLQIRGPSWPAGQGLPVVGGKVRSRTFPAVVRGAQVSLGIGARDPVRGEWGGSTSNRLWKVLGARGCYVGEYSPGIERLATPGVHAFWYHNVDEAQAMIAACLADAELRQRVAVAGHAHAHAAHTYAHRLPLLLAGQDYTST